MITSRWKKVWADFWGSRGRTFLTVLTIMVGTFAVGATNNLRLYMSQNMDSDYLSAKPSEATIYTSLLDDDMVKIAREVPGVDGVEGRSVLGANLIHSDGKPIPILFTAFKDPNNLTVNQLKPAKGETEISLPGRKQIVLDSSAAVLGYKPGDTVTIELINGKQRQLTVAGYVHDITAFQYMGRPGDSIPSYVTPETMEWLGGSRSYNALAVSVAENQTDQKHVTDVAHAVGARLEDAGAEIYYYLIIYPGHHYTWSTVQAIFFLIIALGYMIVFSSAFLIINTIIALMAQHTRQIGIMKAVGGGTLQIFGMYLSLILLFGLVALFIAIPLANGAARFVGTGMSERLNFFALPYKPYTQTIVQQIIVALVVPLLATILPVYSSVRVTVRDALTDYGIGANAKPKVRRVSKGALLIPRPIRLSLRNAFRRKIRLALTLFALVLGGSIFMAVYNMWATFDKMLEDVKGYYLSDVNILFDRYYRFEEVAPIALSNAQVSTVEGWIEYNGMLITNEKEAGTEISFVAPPSTSTLIKPIITSGRWLTRGDENAIVIGNTLLRVFPNLKIGDWLTIKIDDKETKWQIVGVYTIPAETGTPMLYVNYEYLSHLTGHPGQVYSLRVLTNQHDGATQARVTDELKTLYKARGIQVPSATTGTEFYQAVTAITDIIIYFMMVMAVLIALVGGLGLMGTMSINVLERTREIGVMRAIGASNGDLQSIVIVEGMVIGIVSWALGILASIPITGVLTYGVGSSTFGFPLPPVIDPRGMIAWLVFTLVLTLISSALPARSASRLTVKDTLAYEG
jgi:putative ABC transport system permease protein